MTIPCQFEPYRVKTVEPIRITTPSERRRLLIEADFNLFAIPADAVMVDLLTDSGTGAMSSAQWAGVMRGDEFYAASNSYLRLRETLSRITGISNVMPVHQGRVAERLLVETIIGKPYLGNGQVVPNNAHFDTTRRMIQASGAEAMNLLTPAGITPPQGHLAQLDIDNGTRAMGNGNTNAPTAHLPLPGARSAFLGNMDVRQLQALLKERSDDVPFVMLTLTCNSNGGQPVSMANLRAVREICDDFGKLLILDSCRFAENAWFIKQYEAGMINRPVPSIVREIFDACDGAAMSARKDALCNVGGLLLLRDDELHAKACNLCVMTEGFQMNYGSLPGRDLEALTIGLHEAMDENYLAARSQMIQKFATQLLAGGVKVIQPVGGHAVYLDAEDFCPHLRRTDHPAHSLACAIYEHGGIRSSRIGSALRTAEGESLELIRLAIPRRTYTQAHLDYCASAIVDLKAHAGEIQPAPLRLLVAADAQEPEFQLAG